MKPADVMSITAPHVSKMTLMRVRRIGCVRVDMALARGAHDLSGTQQFRADRQIAGSRSLQIDAQADAAVFSQEIDECATRRGPFGHCKAAAILQSSEDFLQVRKFSGRNKEDLAAAQMRHIGVALDCERMPVH